MLKVVVSRVLSGLVTLLLAITIAFFLARGTGSPAKQILGDGATAQKQCEHWLPDNIENDASEFPAVGIGKFVWPELPEAGRGLGRVQPNFCCPIH